MFDRNAIAWAIYRSGTPENLRELTECGNAGPIADAVIAALSDAMHKSGVSNRPLNADALSTPTEDARERVKVLEEAARVAEHIVFGVRAATFAEAQGRAEACEAIAEAIRALGNKETDRHG